MKQKPRAIDAAKGSPETAAVMAGLLQIHSAVTLQGLADAAASCAERVVSAPFTFLYMEDEDGRLDRKAPSSEVRRRSLQRAIDAFGNDALRSRVDPTDAPAIAEALDGRTPVCTSAEQLFRGLADAAAVADAQQRLAIECVCLAPLESAGERVGALLLLFAAEPDTAVVELFAQHVARAASNIRQNLAAQEQGAVEPMRSVFGAQKLESELEKELARATRYKHEVSIAVIEATNLRLMREQFGLRLTDQLLQRLGAGLAENSRDIDVIGAYKDSGYTMILTQASADGAGIAAGRLLQIARETRLGIESVPGLELHLACGWATCPIDGASAGALFAAAERRMYDQAQQVA